LLLVVATSQGRARSGAIAPEARKACHGQVRSASSVATGIGRVLGTGTVRVGAIADGGVAATRALDGHLAGWRVGKILWVIRHDMGASEISGRRRASGDLVRWGDGPVDGLDGAALEALPTALQVEPGSRPLQGSEWSDHPSSPVFPGVGCYAFTIRGEVRTEKVIIRVR